ncbi:MAG: hypothetical protein PVI40_09195 [Chlamydiota bacterium]|jgi:hypothetical protein
MSTSEITLHNGSLLYNPPDEAVFYYKQAEITLMSEPGYEWIELSTLRLKFKGLKKYHTFSFPFFSMVPKEVLPFNRELENLTSLLGYLPGDSHHQDKLVKITSLLIDTENEHCSFKKGLSSEIGKIKVINKSLRKACQKKLGNIPVETGRYPIFFDNRQPSFDAIDEIFKKFIQHNTKEKLRSQQALSENRCSMRAQFISVVLDMYRITTTKIVKVWKLMDWNAFPTTHNPWGFHCANMIMDRDGQYWIWDPWFGSNQELLPLERWVKKTDEPTPKLVIINNKTIIKDPYGTVPDSPCFMQIADSEELKTFQALWMDAVPNPPEKPISMITIEEESVEASSSSRD